MGIDQRSPDPQQLLDLFHSNRTIEREFRRASGECVPPEARQRMVQCLLSYAALIDTETRDHVHRVGAWAYRIARALGWTDADAEDLRVAGALHDVGKVGIAPGILQKRGPLTTAERRVVFHHTWLGHRIFGRCRSRLLGLAQEVALSHHEHWSGTGYPQGLRGTAIPESARIVALADVYDALTSDRPYRQALPRDAALAILADARGRQFDPRVHDAFVLLPAEPHETAPPLHCSVA